MAKVKTKMTKSYAILMLMATVGGFLQILEAEIVFLNANEETADAFAIKAAVSATTLVLLRLLWVHYLDSLLLGKLRGEYHEKDTLYSSELMYRLVPELIMCAVHCPPGVCAVVSVNAMGTVSEYTTDAMASFVICVRCYLAIRYIHNLDQSNNSVVALTLGGIGSVEFTPWHTFKQLVMDRGGSTVTWVFVVLMVIHAHLMRVTERPSNESFEEVFSCLWCSVITMTTVGYGDMYPESHMGRLVAISAAVFGTIVLALLVTAITKATELKKSEELFALMIHESEDKLRWKAAAASVIAMTVRAMVEKKRLQKQLLAKRNVLQEGVAVASAIAQDGMDKIGGLVGLHSLRTDRSEQRLLSAIRLWRRAKQAIKTNRMRRLQHDPHAPIASAIIGNADLLEEMQEAQAVVAGRIDRIEMMLASLCDKLGVEVPPQSAADCGREGATEGGPGDVPAEALVTPTGNQQPMQVTVMPTTHVLSMTSL